VFEHSKDAPKENASTVAEKLTSIGLKKVFWAGRYEADKMSQGKYDVLAGDGGHFALVFDNTFSKSFSKNVTFFLLSYPSKYPPSFGAQLHHSQAGPAMATVFPPLQTTSPRLRASSSPRLKAVTKDSIDSLKQVFAQQAVSAAIPAVPETRTAPQHSAMIFTGVLQKRRRKKHQGYARRFFSLDFTSSTLSYYHDRNSSALRGAIPLSLAAIGANAKTREISIDSGAEIWHLRANNNSDFDEWKRALHKASTLLAEAKTPADALDVQTEFNTPGPGSYADEQDWARLEGLLSRISGIRDAVRRLCIETETKMMPPLPSGLDSGPATPTDGGGEDYFKQTGERRPFWKRKASAASTGPSIFKRSSSAQLAVPSPDAEQTTNGRAFSPVRPPVSTLHLHDHGEDGMHKHCKAMLHDLDSVVSEFSIAVSDRRQSRLPVPNSALSRMSLQSVDSQEYFDALDQNGSAFLDIQSDSDGPSPDETVLGDTESATSSDIDDDEAYVGSRKAFRSGSLSSLLPAKAKTLTPLPLEPVKRRATITPPTIMPPSLIGFLRKNVGKDLSTISMPVSANEPTSLLQRASEQLEYSSLLDRAASATDAVERLIFVTAFAVSGLSNARIKERSIRKPFNPMLGETFELVREDRGFRFVAEKVSHRPVQLAFHAESGTWSFTQSPLPSQKFWGKSSEIVTDGKARLILHSSGECLSWSTATCFLRNIIAGEKYVEPVGTMTIVNETTGHKAVVTFKSKGMFSGRSEDVEVSAFDSHGGEVPLGLHGTWTNSLQLKEHGTVTKTAIWTAGPLVNQPAKHYGMTLFAASLNEVTPVEKDHLPPTDSRLRPDQKALEDGDHETAERVKNALEEKQRERRRDMESKGEEWKPRWFTRVENGDEVVWKLKGGKEGYWEERVKGTWIGVVPVLVT
jgi:oxysterol-binding protein-related protein 3/6/7